jgi:hypothetical protein
VIKRYSGPHALHDLLADAYRVQLPDTDIGPVVVLLDRLGATQRTIAELLDRFTPYRPASCLDRVARILGGDDPIPPDEVDRVERLLAEGQRRGRGAAAEDGPDRLHRIHDMLAGAYPTEMPERDYPAVIALLRRLGLSVSGILEIAGRFAPRGKLVTREEIEAIVAGQAPVPDVARADGRLRAHGLAELAKVENPPWVRTKEEPDPDDPRIPRELQTYWRALLRVRPEGVDLREYPTLVIALRDAGLADDQIKLLVSSYLARPPHLVQMDLDRVGTDYMDRRHVDGALKAALSFTSTPDASSPGTGSGPP